MRFTLTACLVALTTASASAQTVTALRIDDPIVARAHPLPLHIGGRVTEEGSGRSKGYRHQWPGVYFEAAFRGNDLIARFDDPKNEYRLILDGGPPIPIAQPGRAAIRIGGLGSGAHRVRLEKVTESVDRSDVFGGFLVPARGSALTPAKRKRRIEFIGDSGMTGYGARASKIQCTLEEVRLTTDTPQAYAALVAKHYGADYQINAISGRGLIRNYGGVEPDDPMAHAYGFDIRDRKIPHADRQWRPQLIMVGLLADFAVDLKPGEKWTSMMQLGTDWGAGYATFLEQLHRHSPDAAIVVGWLDLTGRPQAEVALAQMIRARIADAAKRAGIRQLHFLVIPNLGFESKGCDYHLTIADHQKLAAFVIDFLDDKGVWRER